MSEIERERGGFIEGIGFIRQNGFILVAGGPKRCRFGGVFFFFKSKVPQKRHHFGGVKFLKNKRSSLKRCCFGSGSSIIPMLPLPRCQCCCNGSPSMLPSPTAPKKKEKREVDEGELASTFCCLCDVPSEARHRQ